MTRPLSPAKRHRCTAMPLDLWTVTDTKGRLFIKGNLMSDLLSETCKCGRVRNWCRGWGAWRKP